MAGLAGLLANMRLSLLSPLLTAALISFANVSLAEEILLTVNIKKPLALTSDKFLSYTLDPTIVLTGNALTINPERNVNMARALSPAYVRIGGPRSNSYTFVRPYNSQNEQDPDFTITEANWIDVHRWAENANLEILACIAPKHSEIRGQETVWDSRNALDLISFSDQMGFNTSWQLGYECQTRCDVAGIDIGRYVTRLRSMLGAFPRYSSSIITGPDVVAYRTRQQQQYLQDYLNDAGNALSAITWHPNFSGITLDAEGALMNHDNLAIDRDILYRVVGRSIWKKPLWLAESKPEECKTQFLGALVWTRRLGNAARLGVQVIMRQPNGSDLLQPTPDYWVSVLHKTLVGREVLDARITTGNCSHVHLYCQCTRPSSRYEKGSLTIFGINLTPTKILISLKGLKIKTIHKYILLPGFDAENRMYSGTVLLNNEPLNLVNDQELPEIKPSVSSNGKGVSLKLPSGGIGFWVLPGLKIKSCGGLDEDNTNKTLSKKSSRHLEQSEFNEYIVRKDPEEDQRNEENVSTEDVRYPSKLSKNRRRRKYRNSEENDNPARRYRKIEARTDLERLEKLLRKRDSYDDRKSSSRGRMAYIDFEEKNRDKLLDNDELDEETSQEIRNKLAEYKKRLNEYESRIKKIESRRRDKSVDNETIDSNKVIEAMNLISKMENAMERLEMSDDDIDIATLNRDTIDDDTTTLVNTNNSVHSDDVFLDELLKSKKIKRASIPTRIEDQLRAIYEMLANEKERRKRNNDNVTKINDDRDLVKTTKIPETNLSRGRRQSEKKFGVDPLGLRKLGMFRRFGRINEETSERMNDRRNRRKDKLDRRDEQPVIFDLKMYGDSEENNFYGFHQRDPIKNFPEGDVYLEADNSTAETTKNNDKIQDRTKAIKDFTNNETLNIKPHHNDDTSIANEHTRTKHGPIEFFENIKMAVPRVHKNLKEYSELWEAESIEKKIDDHSSTKTHELPTLEKIVQEQQYDIRDNERTNKLTAKKLIGYYDDPTLQRDKIAGYQSNESTESSILTIDDEADSRMDQVFTRNPVVKKKRVKNLTSGKSGSLTDFNSMHFVKSSVSSAEERAFVNYDLKHKPNEDNVKRSKRSMDDLEHVFDREMIFQDDNNLKDCECRVTRSMRNRRTLKNTGKSNKRQDRTRRPNIRRRNEEISNGLRNRKLERSATSKPDRRHLDESYSRTTRSRREVEDMNEKIIKLTTNDPRNVTSYQEPPTTEEMHLKESPSLTNEKNSKNEKYKNTDYEFSTNEDVGDLSNAEREKRNGEETKNVTLKEKMIDHITEISTMFNQDQTSKNYRTFEEQPEVTESSVKNTIIVESSILKDSSQSAEVRLETTEAPSIKFRKRVNNKGTSKTFEKIKELDKINSSKAKLLEPLTNLATSSSENNNRILETRAIVSTTKNEDSSPKIVDKTTKIVERANGDDGKNETMSNQRDSSRSSILKNRTNAESTTTPVSANVSDAAKNYLSESIKNETASTIKTARRKKKASKSIDRTKLRETRVSSRSEARSSHKKEKDTRKTRKSERADRLEKLRNTLRQKREKFESDYRDEFLNELAETSNNGEEKNLRRRDVIDMIMNDEELRDLVDSEKFEYLMRNVPINYEATENEHGVEDPEVIFEKYVPDMVEIVRPLQATRERRVLPRKQSIGATNDPTLLAYPLPIETLHFGDLKSSTESLTNHKIERRDDKSYYNVVESLEKPQIYEPLLDDEDSGEEMSIEIEDSIEFDRPPTDLSSSTTNHEITHNYDGESDFEASDNPHRRDYRKNHETSDSQPGTSRGLEIFDDSTRSVQNTPNDNYMCVKESSKVTSNENSDELFELVKENDHYRAMPFDGTNIDDKDDHKSKKRNLKNSDYELSEKYDNPKYARLSMDKSEFARDERLARQNIADHENSGIVGNEKTSMEIDPKIIMTDKTLKHSGDSQSWVIKGVRENLRKRNLAMIDDVDLDEALNSNKYELMMLIPVSRSQKRNRHRRHVNNEILRDQGNSVGNDMTIDMMPKNNELRTMTKNKRKYTNANNDIFITKMNELNSDRSINIKDISNENEDNNLIFESSTMAIVQDRKTSMKKDQTIPNGYATGEIFRSVPKIVANGYDKSFNDEGLPELLEEAIPKLETTVTGGLDKARRISQSFEKFIDDFDDSFNQEQVELQTESNKSDGNEENNCPISSGIFDSMFMNVTKFFNFLGGLVHIFRLN